MLLLLACTASTLQVGSPSDSRPPRDADPDTVEDIGGLGDDTAADDTAPEENDDDSVVFNLDAIHTVSIDLGRDGRAALDRDPYTYVSAEVTFDGETYSNVGVRIKGRLGSLRTLASKAALKLDFREFGETERLHGIEKLNLNNMVQDCAKVHELAAYGVHRMTGTPAPRLGYAEVTVDGTPHGLYSVVEDYDDEFLQKNYADPTGNLYDGDYYLWSNGSYTLVDFSAASQDYFQLDEGTDVGLADIRAVTDALAPGGLAGAAGLMDLDQHAAFLAVNAWTGQYDSYSYYSNNYRVYFDPARGGRGVMMPWDPDWAWYAATNVASPYALLSQRCLADTDCRAKVSTTIDELNSSVSSSELADELHTAIDLIEPALARDPMLESSTRDIRSCQADLFDWFDRRGGELERAGL